VLLPHIGSATVPARDGMARAVADNVIAVLEGRDPPSRVA
jgi:lactate dehydrogenase-like 2-hydroxyacid dehydrogenase